MVPVENLIGRATGHLLVDRRQRVLLEAVDLVHGASRQPHRQRLHRRRRMSEVAPFVRESSATSRRTSACSSLRSPIRALAATATSGSSSSATGCWAMVIARALYERYPNEPEGYLSRRYNVLVARETCADIGREIGVPSAGPARQAGARRRRQPERQCRRRRRRGADRRAPARRRAGRGRALHPHALGAAPRRCSARRRSTPSPRFRSWRRAKGCKAPVYEVVARTGAHHAPKFTIRVSVPRLGEATAEGTSKQEAETAAAAALLSQLQ